MELNRSPELMQHRRSFRWIHIDGEHTGQAVGNDLAIAHELLADDGIICIDDFFNPAYAQVSAASFPFYTRGVLISPFLPAVITRDTRPAQRMRGIICK